jgi:excinuclease UvrABC ATPase subunit
MSGVSLKQINGGDILHAWVVAKSQLSHIERLAEQQREVLKELKEKTRAVLGRNEKFRVDFSLDMFSSEEKKFIDNCGGCNGLRLSKRTRREYLSDKKIQEVLTATSEQLLKELMPSITPEITKAFAHKLCEKINADRKTTVQYDVQFVVANKEDGRKRKAPPPNEAS